MFKDSGEFDWECITEREYNELIEFQSYGYSDIQLQTVFQICNRLQHHPGISTVVIPYKLITAMGLDPRSFWDWIDYALWSSESVTVNPEMVTTWLYRHRLLRLISPRWLCSADYRVQEDYLKSIGEPLHLYRLLE